MTGNAPLLLLPGMLCDGEFWRAQIDGLADVCVPQVAGFGSADTISAMAEAALRAAPPRFALAGHSMGGRVALAVYARAPDRVVRLGLFCTDFRAPEGEPARRAEAAERDALLAMARVGGMDAFARIWVRRVVAPDNLEDARFVAPIIAMFARQSFETLEAHPCRSRAARLFRDAGNHPVSGADLRRRRRHAAAR